MTTQPEQRQSDDGPAGTDPVPFFQLSPDDPLAPHLIELWACLRDHDGAAAGRAFIAATSAATARPRAEPAVVEAAIGIAAAMHGRQAERDDVAA